jgi:hypothetical protein
LINTTTAGDRSIDGVSTVSEFIDLLDKQQQDRSYHLQQQQQAQQEIDRSIDREIDQQQQQRIGRSTAYQL